ncbi:hypothetical protein SSABA_v1c08650 [Spiroplasma sabaudiense Ar-1343]|uniref:Transmembrane protein n=1 Tax=Spiroplasma sabaudiense Ar-1343 TaxID=1276257 RepID=W6AKL8_9MOLU|nr:hypothetical protein [Spiroplasma sabaudiense]AHI54264.1 hypothetical protein SSABA_v1c08650 [Spiroplasma sabaudiense Ar-1343]
MKNLSKKVRKFLLASIASFMGLIFILGMGLSLPGMGIESLKFINSVKDTVNKNFPKGKFVIDGNGQFFEYAMEKSVRSSYTADVMSATNWYEDSSLNQKHEEEYLEFANNWFDNRWGRAIENKEDVDLNDVSMDLIIFDQAFAAKYHSFGYVNPGITWIWHKGVIADLLSPNLAKRHVYQDALEKQTIIDQDIYDQNVEHSGPGLGGIKVKSSYGAYLVNNKVWFVNMQRENVKFAMTAALGGSVFKNKKLTENDLPGLIDANRLYHPNFTAALRTTAAGVGMLIIVFPIILIFGVTAIVYIYIANKK